jgi:hypothetical protein
MNTPTPRTDALRDKFNADLIGKGDLLAEYSKLETELNEARLGYEVLLQNYNADTISLVASERDKAKEILSHFITHYEALDYSEATLDELEKIAVDLWSVIKERDQLRKICDELASTIYVHSLRPQNALDTYNQLPHVLERKTK